MANVTSDEYSFSNKSWVELYEEEHPDERSENSDVNFKIPVKSNPVKNETTDKQDEYVKTAYFKDEEKSPSHKNIEPEVESDRDVIDLWVSEESRMSLTSSPAKCKSTPPKNFSTYANALKSVSPDSKNANRNSNCDVSHSDNENKKCVKREIQKEFLHDDLSLTSHLDVFHMQSPCKQREDSESQEKTNIVSASDTWSKDIEGDFPKINEWPRSGKKNSSVKKETQNDTNEVRGGKRRLPLMQVDAEQPQSQQKANKIPDEILMPSPSKIIRSFGNGTENTKSPRNSIVESRKRQRESYSSPSSRHRNNFLSPSHKQRDSFSSPSNRSHSDIEYETDPTILTRRQKQIDYGKNTVGYERYTTEVPREMREKNHPKTPPRHLKFSRRAWDGLVKNWRRRLHYWDPPSEGGGNPELLEDLNESELSEFSGNESFSLPNSLPSTPQQDWKRRKGKESEHSPDEDDNDYYINDRKYYDDEGCKPLDDD